MSEYQYYEFQALDRRLSREEMAEIDTFLLNTPLINNLIELHKLLIRVVLNRDKLENELER